MRAKGGKWTEKRRLLFGEAAAKAHNGYEEMAREQRFSEIETDHLKHEETRVASSTSRTKTTFLETFIDCSFLQFRPVS